MWNVLSIYIQCVLFFVIDTPRVEAVIERFPVCSPSLNPKIGMNFKTLEEGIKFYEKYAEVSGFVSRRSS